MTTSSRQRIGDDESDGVVVPDTSSDDDTEYDGRYGNHRVMRNCVAAGRIPVDEHLQSEQCGEGGTVNDVEGI